ncbi:MAG: MarR family winged helix-turn-helix transcriptional regulator [Ktedonobacterales bacterium]
MRSLSVPRMRLLHVIAESGAQRLRMRDLSTALGVTARNVTTIVDGLEREGFLVRRRDTTDRRAILLELTEFGHAHIARTYELQIRMSERLFAPLDPGERCVFMRLLEKIRCGADALQPVELSQRVAPQTADTDLGAHRGRGRRRTSGARDHRDQTC